MLGTTLKNFVMSVLLVSSYNNKVFARSVVSDPASRAGDVNQIEQIFPSLELNSSAVKFTYDTYATRNLSTICWNEITTLHFFKNGSCGGYVEYSISMELAPAASLNRRDNVPKEQYEVYHDDPGNGKILDFVVVQSSPEETVKENKTVICKSDKAYTKTFIDVGTRQKVEIRVRPTLVNVKEGGVWASSNESQAKPRIIDVLESTKNIQEETQLQSDPTRASNATGTEPPLSETESVGFTRSRIAQGDRFSEYSEESGEDKKSGSDVSTNIKSTLYEPVSGEEAISSREHQQQDDNTSNTSELNIRTIEKVASEETAGEERHFLTDRTKSTKQLKSFHADKKLQEGSDRSQESSATTKEHNILEQGRIDCTDDKKLKIKMKMNIEDDAGKIDDIVKNIEIDFGAVQNVPRLDSFDGELAALVKNYYGDVVKQHKLCPKNQNSMRLRSLYDSTDNYDGHHRSGAPRNFLLPTTTTSSLNLKPNKDFVAPRNLDDLNGNEDRTLIRKIFVNLKQNFRNFFNRK